MYCTVDAHALLQVLKSINIRYNMHEFVQLQVQDGKLTLRTCTEPLSAWSLRETPWMTASASLTESLTIVEDGRHSAQYQELVNAVRMFDGSVTLRREEQAVIVERPGELKQQTPVEGTSDFPEAPVVTRLFPEAAVAVEVGATYTRKETQWGNCPTCNSRERKDYVDLYQIIAVTSQRACIERERLFSMFKQIEWAVASENDYDYQGRNCTGVYIGLNDEMLLLQARDRHSIAQCREPLPHVENWEHGVLIPAKQLKRALQLLPKKAEVHLEAILLQHQHIKRDEENVPDTAPFIRAREIHLTSGDVRITLSLMNDGFPDYQPFFSRTRETQVVCATSDLLNACEAVANVAQERRNGLWLHVNEAGISIEAKHELSPKPALHQVPAMTRTGEDISIATGPWYLPQVLKAINSPQVTIEISTPEDPIVLRPTDGQCDFRCAVTAAKVV